MRVDSYTNVHLVAELSDGEHYVVQRFVKASGGCSAPMAKDAKEAKAAMGQMKLRQFLKEADAATGPQPDERDVQIMLRHPNNSGMQMDQLTRLYIPPLFVDELKVWQGEDLILAVDGGISISEDPNFRFTYRNASLADFRVEIVDSDKHLYFRHRSCLQSRAWRISSPGHGRHPSGPCRRRVRHAGRAGNRCFCRCRGA